MNPDPSTTSGPLAEPLRTQARADTWFRLRGPDDVAGQIRELLGRELELAAEGLWVSPGPALDAGILYAHSAVDKSDALVRMARGGLKKSLRKEVVGRLAGVAEALDRARDPGTVEDVVERIRQSTREPELRDGLMVLGGRLAERRYRSGAATRDDGALGEARAELEALRGECPDWRLKKDGFALLRGGLRRLHRDGSRALEKAAAKPGSAKRHRRLMARTRELGYALRLLEPVWACPLKATEHEADRVTGRLQEADELDRLVARAGDDPTLVERLPWSAMAERMERIRDRFRSEALATARRLYAEEPEVFRDRLGTWWNAWEEETGQGTGS